MAQNTQALIFVSMGVLAGVSVNFFRDYMVVLDFLYPVHWVWLTMIGYVITLPFHFCTRTPHQNDKSPLPWAYYAGCMLLDAMGMICSYWALGALSAAIAQMMRGCKLVIVTAMKCCMGTLPKRQHIFGVVISMGGLALVAAGSFAEKKARNDMHKHHGDSDSDAKLWQAFALCFAAELFFATFFVFQEHVVRNYEVTPYQLIGWMGVIGFFTVGAFLLFSNLVLNLLLVENSAKVMRHLQGSQIIQIILLAYMVIQGVKMLIGVKISELTSAEIQVFVELGCCAVIWGIEISLGWITFQILHLFGFLIIGFGMVTYVGMIAWLRAEASEETLPFANQAKQETQGRNDTARSAE
eukprot:gnl/TRDRNA2_/TRDRNA2_128512_c0_seq1.p1 gnl/TRDRNA2_/TRDRNA2_128512_c0~~gnl/TRDRNA2_/TRDRNA2_128512_c0_seq1.p1  ORF type:complete len:354 (-),score=34.29 gnl/TRDRNA2_/TRDRNA2_128512_c0_seq1:119-1180(-)